MDGHVVCSISHLLPSKSWIVDVLVSPINFGALPF